MKKRLLLIALASTMLLAACNKNNNESQGEAVFTATTEHQGGRTSLDPNNGNINWTAGDQIVIANDNDETATFSLRSGEGTTEGGFGTADDFNTVGPFVAAYPETATIANDVVTFNLPATQAIGETGTFANGANPMVACSDDKNLQFKNLCGGLGIRLKGVGAHVSAVRITSKNTSEKLWGTFEVSNCAANEPTLTEAANNQGTNVITLTCDVTLTTAAKTFFVMLPPGTLANGFTMEVLDGNEVLATKETTSDIAFVERNNVKVFNEILVDVEFDGNVEIPVGMSESDIFVTNFNDDAIPDENGDFVIGYSKLLMAMNSNNGKLVYFTVNSVDGNILKGESDNNVDYELSAKETALFLTLRCLPFSMRRASDASLSTFKEILYSLQCVKDLETAIQNVVDTYGYLKEDELVDAMNTLKTFLYNELGLNLGDGKREMKEVVQNTNGKNEELQSPYLPDDAEFGTRFFIKDKYHSTLSPEKWTINCTGYNGLPTAFGVVKGQVEGRKSIGEEGGDRNFFIDFEYDENEVMYYLAPTGLMNVIDVLTLSDWQGFKRLFQELYYMIHNQTTIPMDFYKSTTDNMQFDLYEPTLGNSNALCVIAPMDNINVYIVNCVFTVMDLFDFALPTYKLDEIIQDFLNDQDYVAMFMSQIQNGAEGRQIILAATEVKFFALAASTLIQSGIQYYLPELAQTLSGLDLIANSFDIVAEISSALYLRSFALSVIAEYSNPPTILPSVTTGTYTVNGTTATISGSLNSIGSYSIAELGVCYSTSQNPSPWSDACVPAEGTDVGTFECVIENLQPNTTYYARAYAKTWVEPLCGYGDVISFTTGNSGGGQVPTDGLVAYYPFNGNANDESGNGNNGILCGSNVPVLTTDRFGHSNSAYEFGGYYNRNYIRVPNSESLIFEQELTISYWIRQTDLVGMDGWGNYSTTGPGFATVCKAGDGYSVYPGLFMMTAKGENENDLRISCCNSNGSSHNQNNVNFDIVATYANYQLGDWINIAVVINNNNKALYLNGQLASQDELMKQVNFSSMNQQDMYIGIFGSSSPYWFPFNGKIDDIRIYNRVLTSAEIQALYNE